MKQPHPLFYKPPSFIADIGSNHNQNWERLRKLAETAKHIGCSAVKLQMYDSRLQRDPEKKAIMDRRSLPKEFVPEFAKLCDALNLRFICTPFNIEAVEFLAPYADELKIGSYEILYRRLIEACAVTGKPTSISTGGATTEEITDAVWVYLRQLRRPSPLCIYQCEPFYPADKWHVNLSQIYVLRSLFPGQAIIGYSDHTVQPDVIYAAMIAGAECIEFHLDLGDQKGAEFEHGHCWMPSEMEEVITKIHVWQKVLRGRSKGGKQMEHMRAGRTDPSDGARPLLVKPPRYL